MRQCIKKEVENRDIKVYNKIIILSVTKELLATAINTEKILKMQGQV